MNFIKNAWRGIFTKQQNSQVGAQRQPIENKQNAKKQEQGEQIPLEVLEQLFTLSSEFVKSSNVTDNNIKLKIYSLYKQAIQGDCNIEQPQIFDFVGRSKWNAWNGLKGMKKTQAMAQYIKIVSDVDPNIVNKINQHFKGQQIVNDEKNKQQARQIPVSSSTGFKKVKQVDYSDQYSHPYFKPIQKMQAIQNISHELLLQKNDQPDVYPLHFAIDKERVDLVEKFLNVLTKDEILSMRDVEGMTILQYAELIQNQEILEMVRNKLGN